MMTEEAKKIAKELAKTEREIRLALGISQCELERRTNVAQPNISRFEAGKYNPTVDFLNNLARGLGKKLVITFENTEETK